MFTEAAQITLCCVLFIQMGLSDAVQKVCHVSLRIASCPRCLTFWACLISLIWRRYGFIESVAASFVASYCALWLSLLYDALAHLYNRFYEKIT